MDFSNRCGPGRITTNVLKQRKHAMFIGSWHTALKYDNRLEVMWILPRAVHHLKPEHINHKYEPVSIRADSTVAVKMGIHTELGSNMERLDQEVPDVAEKILPYLYPLSSLPPKILPTVDLSFVVIEYKRKDVRKGDLDNPNPNDVAYLLLNKFVRQAAMAMVVSLHHWHGLGLCGQEWPVFGIVITIHIARLYVGWMEPNTLQVFISSKGDYL